MNRRGFTWIELLVVVLIVAVLAAILFPVFARCVQYTSCAMPLSKLTRATSLYVMDYDQRYPPAGLACTDPSQPDGSSGCRAGALTRDKERYGYPETWQGGGLAVIQPYLKEGDYWWDRHHEKARLARLTDARSYYGAFEWLRSPARVRYPAQKVLLIEAYSYHSGPEPVRFDAPAGSGRKHYVGFVDGHVKFVDLAGGCSVSSHTSCRGWESCLGPGGNGNYICSGYGAGVNVPDFP